MLLVVDKNSISKCGTAILNPKDVENLNISIGCFIFIEEKYVLRVLVDSRVSRNHIGLPFSFQPSKSSVSVAPCTFDFTLAESFEIHTDEEIDSKEVLELVRDQVYFINLKEYDFVTSRGGVFKAFVKLSGPENHCVVKIMPDTVVSIIRPRVLFSPLVGNKEILCDALTAFLKNRENPSIIMISGVSSRDIFPGISRVCASIKADLLSASVWDVFLNTENRNFEHDKMSCKVFFVHEADHIFSLDQVLNLFVSPLEC